MWKAVKNLEEEGYEIHAASNRGYRLLNDSDVLSEAGIRLSLESAYKDYPVVVLKDTDSTNQEVKKTGVRGSQTWSACAGGTSDSRKGKKGQGVLFSDRAGIYMSILFRPTGEKCVQCGVDHNGSRRGSVPGHS